MHLGSCVAQSIKYLPAIRETGFNCWCQEVPLEKETATHSSILAWRIPWTEEPGMLYIVQGIARVRHDLVLLFFFFFEKGVGVNQEGGGTF